MAVLCFSSRTAWVQKIKAASEQYIDTEKKKREKAYQGSGSCPAGLEPATRGPGGRGGVLPSGHRLLLQLLQRRGKWGMKAVDQTAEPSSSAAVPFSPTAVSDLLGTSLSPPHPLTTQPGVIQYELPHLPSLCGKVSVPPAFFTLVSRKGGPFNAQPTPPLRDPFCSIKLHL